MQHIAFSTDDVPEANRFAYWREAVCEDFIGVSGERDKDEETPFNGKLEGWIGESLARLRYRSDRFRVLRRPRDIARRSWHDSFCVYRESGAGAWFDQDWREFVTRSGDLVISDTSVHIATEPRTSYNHEMWLLPRRLLDPHLPVSRSSRSLVLTGSEGVVGMVKAYIDAFAAQIDTLADAEVGCIADALCRLLAVAWGGEAGEQGQAIRLARLEDAKPSGTSFAQYVLRRRLEECRAALMSPIGGRSVTAVAFAWGFNSLPTFYRTFRQAFGVTPGALRANAAWSQRSGRC